jgi:ABC-type sulfate transport system, periplasmic component
MAKMFNQKKVPVMDKGARGATNTFVVNQKGDVLLAWENELCFTCKTAPS